MMADLKTIVWQGPYRGDILETAVTFAEIMAENGYYVQAFPEFQRLDHCFYKRAFNRISGQPIRIRSQVEKADIIMILKPDPNQIQWQELVHEETTFIFNCGSIDMIQTIMETNDKNIRYVDFDTINSQRENTDPSVPILAVVIKELNLITMEQLTETLETILANKYNSDQVADCLKSVSLALAGVENNG